MSGGSIDFDGQGTLFEERFLGRYAGSIMSDPTTALVELVANAWDAYATKVDIVWPDRETHFSVTDNGIGMTPAEFEVRWRTLDYDRSVHQGLVAFPPPGLKGQPRTVFGRNGKGRLAAFYFSSPYQIRTWRDGAEATYLVSQGKRDPIKFELVTTKDNVSGHGTQISAIYAIPSHLGPQEVRSILSTRFLTNPDFKVSVNGVLVTFGDVPNDCLVKFDIDIPKRGKVHVMVLDSQKTDRSAKQHGIAWWVNRRLVGQCGWRQSDQAVIDGRTEVARRLTFIVQADFLADAVTPDWSDFKDNDVAWRETEPLVQNSVRDVINEFTKERRNKTKEAVSRSHKEAVKAMPVLSRDRWMRLLDKILVQCPNLSEAQVDQIMGLLANLELADSQYSLLQKLHALTPDQLDEWDAILEKWTVSAAKIVLDEVEKRLRIIEEIKAKTADNATDEVQDLQPLFARALWILGPQFESIEFTSNKGMTTVIKELFDGAVQGSRNRPDFAITPDSTVGFYSRPAFNSEFNEDGTDTLVIVELKKPGVKIGPTEKDQVWKYVSELFEHGYVSDNTWVYGFVLGDSIRAADNRERKEGDRTFIRPMLYSTFVGQAEKRMMNLQNKLLDAPFMKEVLAELYPAPTTELDELTQGILALAVKE